MLKVNKPFSFIIIVTIIFFLALNPEHLGDKEFFKNDDKAKHVLAFFVLSFSLFLIQINVSNILKVFFLIFIAFLIEFLQTFVGRESSIWDFLFSTLGILLFIVLKIVIK